jgi:hypothetical protein
MVTEKRPDMGLIVTSGAKTLEPGEIPDHGSFLPKPYGPQQLTDALRGKL